MPRHNGNVAASEPATVHEEWIQWPVYWTPVWVGVLAALATALVIGLAGIAVGGHVLTGESRLEGVGKIGLSALAFGVLGSFFAFVVGGWVAGKVAGILRAETAMLHGAIVWLVATPLLVGMAALGAGSFFGSWYGGLAGTPSWVAREAAQEIAAPTPLGEDATTEERARYAEADQAFQRYQAEKDQAARAARNTALTSLTALLLGLIGGVLGGWMASGEPMSLTYHRTRRAATAGETGARTGEQRVPEAVSRR